MKKQPYTPNQRQIDLSISMLSFNTKDYLSKCLQSLFKNNSNVNFEIILTDNASSDGTSKFVAKNYPQIRLTKSKKNLMYIKGHNSNLKRIRGEYFLILNEDTILPKNTLKRMLQFVQNNPKIGLASCRQVDENGKIDQTCSKSPHPIYEILEISYINKLLGKLALFKKLFNDYRYYNWDRSSTRQVDVVPGSFIIGRSGLLKKVGLFDQKNLLFFYGEPDYCARVKRAGYQIYHNSDVTITHLKSKALTKLPSTARTRISQHDLFAYYKKYFGLGWWLVLRLIFLPNRFFGS